MSTSTFQNYQFYYRSDRRDSALCLCTCGHDATLGTYQWGPEARAYYLLHYVFSGTYVIKVSGKEYHLHAGDLWVIWPDTPYSIYSPEKQHSEYCWFGFVGTECGMLLKRLGIYPKHPVIHIGEDQEIRELHRDLSHTCGNKLSDSIAMTGKLYLFFSRILSHVADNDKHDSADSFQLALDYIHTHLPEGITVDDVCRRVNVSRSWLHRLFVTNTGETTSHYISHLRLAQASYYLRHTHMSISEIAAKVGYSDPLYFSRVFKDYIGASPRAYRLANQQLSSAK